MSATVGPVLKRSFHLHSHEVDQKGRAKPDVLFCFLMDSAWAHANKSEFSYDALKAEGQLWVLSRFLALFHKLPMWDDEIEVETWSKGADKLFGVRDFIIRSQSGEKLVSATSAWLVIDRKTSRIQRIDLVNSDFPHQLDKHAIDKKLDKIEPMTTYNTAFSHIVRYSDLDVNRHVNSSRYLEWILDSFPADFLENNTLGSLELNFLSEAKIEEKIVVAAGKNADGYLCEVKRSDDGTDLCRAFLKWN